MLSALPLAHAGSFLTFAREGVLSGRYEAGDALWVRLLVGGTVGLEGFFWVAVLAEGDRLGMVELRAAECLARDGVEDVFRM